MEAQIPDLTNRDSVLKLLSKNVRAREQMIDLLTDNRTRVPEDPKKIDLLLKLLGSMDGVLLKLNEQTQRSEDGNNLREMAMTLLRGFTGSSKTTGGSLPPPLPNVHEFEFVEGETQLGHQDIAPETIFKP